MAITQMKSFFNSNAIKKLKQDGKNH